MGKTNHSELAKYIADQLESGVSSSSVARSTAAYLLDNRASREAARVMRIVKEEMNRRGQTQVEILSAHTVSDAVKRELANLLDAKNPQFHEVVDKSVIGGVKATAGERQIDLTVRAKLNSLKMKVSKS